MRRFVSSRRAPAAVLAVLFGCGGDASSSEHPPDASPPPAITGTIRTVHWDAADHATEIGDRPDGVFVEAQVPGEAAPRPARIADDGTFAVDGAAPAAPYWLRVVDPHLGPQDVYVLTDATQLDLGRDVVGTIAASAVSGTTQVVVGATGLSPWQDGDDGEFVIADLGFFSSVTPFYATGTPAAGDTALATTYHWQGLPLSPPAHGAPGVLVQTRFVHDDALALDYETPVKGFASDPIAIAEATTTHVAGAFADPTPLDVPVRWTRSAFVAQGNAMHPPGCSHALDFETYWVHALPGHAAHGDLARSFLSGIVTTPEFGPAIIDEVALGGAGDLDGTLHVANPFPRAWLFAKYAASFVVDCPVAGTLAPGNAEAEIGVVTDDLGRAPVTPPLGPVRAPQIAGRDLFALQSGVGLAPTISWTPPAIGTPTSYEVHVSEVVVMGGFRPRATLHEDAVLVVPGDVTRVTLPPDVLTSGVTYTLRIRAVARAGQAVRTAPFRSGIPYAFADLYTSYLQP